MWDDAVNTKARGMNNDNGIAQADDICVSYKDSKTYGSDGNISMEVSSHSLQQSLLAGQHTTKEHKSLCRRLYPTGFYPEMKANLNIAWSIVFTQLCISSTQPIATMFGGHLGKLELDAVGLSNTIINITGTSIAVGTSTACYTVFSQTYGAKNYKLLGVLLQRSVLIIMLAILPCYALHLNLESILILLGQNPDVARLAGEYVLIFMPGLFCSFLSIILRSYTQSQNVVVPLFIIGIVSVVTCVAMQYILLFVVGWGIRGSAIAQVITNFVMCLLTILYMVFSRRFKDTWDGWSMQSLAEWGFFAKLAVLGLLMVCFEWWAFEVTVVMAGILGNTELGAQTIMFNLNSFPLAIAIGIGNATSVRVGQTLGAGDPEAAKTAARVGMTISTCVSMIMMVLYATLRFQLPQIFTTDPDVIQLTASLLPIAAFYTVCDYQTASFRGILRGCGKQSLGMVVAFISYNIIALPVGIPLMFLTPLRISGAWIGLCIALVFSVCVYYVYVMYLANWEDLSRRAQKVAGEKSAATYDTHKRRDSETTPLVSKSDYPHEYSGRPVPPSAEHDTCDANCKVTARTVISRTAVIATFFGILAVGILSRYFAPQPSPRSGWVHANQTVPFHNASLPLDTFRQPYLNLNGLY